MHDPPIAWQATLSAAERGEVQEIISEQLDRARAEWPGVLLDVECFTAAATARASSIDELRRLRATDLYIAHACLAGIDGAMEAFRVRFVPRIRGAARAWRPSSDQAEEIEQRCWQLLFVAEAGATPALASYAARGDLRAFIRSIATRTARRVVKADARHAKEASDAGLDGLIATDPDPEVETLKRLYRDEFSAAFRSALACLTPRQRNLLRQSFIDGLGIDQLGAVYRVHRATAARWLAAARTALFEGTKHNLSAAVGASDATAESIIRLVHSQLEFSIHEFLG